jgi:hypothetical protein
MPKKKYSGWPGLKKRAEGSKTSDKNVIKPGKGGPSDNMTLRAQDDRKSRDANKRWGAGGSLKKALQNKESGEDAARSRRKREAGHASGSPKRSRNI